MWNLLLDDEEQMIIDAAREYLGSELPVERLRPNSTPIDEDKVYDGMVDLGWIGLGLPESVNGSGLGLVGEMLIQRECGRHLVSPRVLATVLGAHVAVSAGAEELARDLICGAQSVTLAMATTTEDSGTADIYAFDPNGGSLLLWNSRGMGLYAAQDLANAHTDVCLDDSLSLQSGTLDLDKSLHWVSAEQQPLGLRARVLLAAGLVGLAEHACDLTVEYAKFREQFGKPIGSFQAVKHRCADMGIRARLAWYQTCLAALKVEAGAADALAQVAAAKLLAGQAAHENGRAAIQLHGGIGFQSECDAHWFMKRAHVYDRLGGAVGEQARLLAREASPF